MRTRLRRGRGVASPPGSPTLVQNRASSRPRGGWRFCQSPSYRRLRCLGSVPGRSGVCPANPVRRLAGRPGEALELRSLPTWCDGPVSAVCAILSACRATIRGARRSLSPRLAIRQPSSDPENRPGIPVGGRRALELELRSARRPAPAGTTRRGPSGRPIPSNRHTAGTEPA